MPKVIEIPKALRPFHALGLEADWSGSGDNVYGDCPFCDREGKFGLNVQTGQWRCYACNEGPGGGSGGNGGVIRGGNVYGFLRALWERGDQTTSNQDYDELTADRSLLYPETLNHWGVCKSPITGEWLVPGYGTDGKLNQLYRYVRDSSGRHLQPTTGLPHRLFGIPLFRPDRGIVYLAEGCWDAMVLWETLRCTKLSVGPRGTPALSYTASEGESMLSTANVLAVPSCTTFAETWCPLFAGRAVVLLYDSDHPRLHCKSCHKSHSSVLHKMCPVCSGPLTEPTVPPGGYTGMRRVTSLLYGSGGKPSEVRTLHWGPDGFDPDRPSGYDVRDFLSEEV